MDEAPQPLRVPGIPGHDRAAPPGDVCRPAGAFADQLRSGSLGGRIVDEELLLKLRRQLEWYFSDSNLMTDHALRLKISEAHPQGWLCCSWLLCKSRVKKLNATPALIFESLRRSHLETRLAPCREA